MAKGVKDLNIDDEKLPTERALGMMWSIEDDEFGFRIEMKDRPLTSRGILSIVSSIYDPFGCVSPAVLPAKQLLQAMCRLKLGWGQRNSSGSEKEVAELADGTTKAVTSSYFSCGVSWPSGLAYRTQVLVLAAECGFESRP